jgi:ribosomal protein L11 methyltransferase
VPLDRRMFVWSKLSAAKGSDAWEERFCGMQDVQPVITAIPGKPTIRIEVYCEKRKDASSIQKLYGGTIRVLKKQNWAALSPPPPDPIRVRNRLVIIGQRGKSEMMKAKKRFPCREILSVPPEMAFGTGHHATTATVLRFIADAAQQWKREGREWTMIDLGCGSGILAMAAKRLGASSAWACDFDPDAVRVSRENIQRNQVDEVTAEFVDVTKWKPTGRHDCVAANIFFDILVDIFPKLVRSVKKDGIVLISGILSSQADECLASGRRAGLVFDRIMRKGKWVSARGRLASSH